mgnify:CR=1 FL=1|jgi:hypothetical protein
MPSYDFKNTETEEVTEYFMSHTKLEEFKKANPLLKQVLSAPNFITRRDGDVLKAAGAGWNEVLQKVGEAHPDSKVAHTNVRRSSKQVATDNIAKKYGLKKNMEKEK